MNSRTTAMAAVISSRAAMESTKAYTRTPIVATASASNVRNRNCAVAIVGAGSARICSTRTAPLTPSSARCFARARLMVAYAASIIANTAASRTKATVRPISNHSVTWKRHSLRSTVACPSSLAIRAAPSTQRSGSYVLALAPSRDDLVVETEHHGLLLRLGVVETKKVEKAVYEEVLGLFVGRPPVVSGLSRGHRRAEHDVAEQAQGRFFVVLGRTQLVHREAQHVGRAGLVHEPHVVVRHRLFIDEQDRHLRLWVDPEAVEGEPGERDKTELVGLQSRLVVDVDHHDLLVGGKDDSYRSYAATILPTSWWRTTSWLVRWQNATSWT